MKVFRVILFLFSWFVIVSCFSQSIKVVGGEEVYYAPENVSVEQAKKTALQRAKIKALADEFGTIISQSSLTFMSNTNGESSVDYSFLGSSDVKGEWIETIGEPQYVISYEDGVLVVSCKIKGKAREIVSAQIDFDAKILRNGVEDRYESDSFRNNDDLYISFKSPIDGYIAIYLIDALKNAYCILPYSSDSDGKVKLKSNVKYIFFNSNMSEPLYHESMVDEYVMQCDEESEINYICIIYSPNSFVKANDYGPAISNNKQERPRVLPLEDFRKWLAKNRVRDKEMQVDIRPVTIKP